MRSQMTALLFPLFISVVKAQGWDTVISNESSMKNSPTENKTRSEQTYTVQYVDKNQDKPSVFHSNIESETQMFELSKDSPQAKQALSSSGALHGNEQVSGSLGSVGMTVDSNISPYNTFIEPIPLQVGSDGSIMYNDMFHETSFKDSTKQTSQTVTSGSENKQQILTENREIPKTLETHETIATQGNSQNLVPDNANDQSANMTAEQVHASAFETLTAELSSKMNENKQNTLLDLPQTTEEKSIKETSQEASNSTQPVDKFVNIKSIQSALNENNVFTETNSKQEVVDVAGLANNMGIMIPDSMVDLSYYYKNALMNNDGNKETVLDTSIINTKSQESADMQRTSDKVGQSTTKDETSINVAENKNIEPITNNQTQISGLGSLDQEKTKQPGAGSQEQLIKTGALSHAVDTTNIAGGVGQQQNSQGSLDIVNQRGNTPSVLDIKSGIEQGNAQVVTETTAGTEQGNAQVVTDTNAETEHGNVTDTKSGTKQGNAQVVTDTNAGTRQGNAQVLTDTNAGTEQSNAQVVTDTNAGTEQGNAKVVTDTNAETKQGKAQEILDTNTGTEQGKAQEVLDTNTGTEQGKAHEILDTNTGIEPRNAQGGVKANVGTEQSDAQGVLDMKFGTDQEKSQNFLDTIAGTEQGNVKGVLDIKTGTEQKNAVLDTSVVTEQENTQGVVDTNAATEQGKSQDVLDTNAAIEQGKAHVVVDTNAAIEQGKAQVVVDTNAATEQEKAQVVDDTNAAIEQGKAQVVVDTNAATEQEKAQVVVDTNAATEQGKAQIFVDTNAAIEQGKAQVVVDTNAATEQEKAQVVVDTNAATEQGKAQIFVDTNAATEQGKAQGVVDTNAGTEQSVVDTNTGKTKDIVGDNGQQGLIVDFLGGPEISNAKPELVQQKGQEKSVHDVVEVHDQSPSAVTTVAEQNQLQTIEGEATNLNQNKLDKGLPMEGKAFLQEKENQPQTTSSQLVQDITETNVTGQTEVQTPGAVGIIIPSFLLSDTAINEQGSSKPIQQYTEGTSTSASSHSSIDKSSVEMTTTTETLVDLTNQMAGGSDSIFKQDDLSLKNEPHQKDILPNNAKEPDTSGTSTVDKTVASYSLERTSENIGVPIFVDMGVLSNIETTSQTDQPKSVASVRMDETSDKAVTADTAQTGEGTPMLDTAQSGVGIGTLDTAKAGVETQIPGAAQSAESTGTLVPAQTAESTGEVDTAGKSLPDTAQVGVDTQRQDVAQIGIGTGKLDTAQTAAEKLLPDKAQMVVDTQTPEAAQGVIDTQMTDTVQIGVGTKILDNAQVDAQKSDVAQTEVDKLLPDNAKTGVDTHIPDAANAGVNKLSPDTPQTGSDAKILDIAQSGVDKEILDVAQEGVGIGKMDIPESVVDIQMPDTAHVVVDTFLPNKAQGGVDVLLPDTTQVGGESSLSDKAQVAVDTLSSDTTQVGVDTLLPDTAQVERKTLLPDKAQGGVDTLLSDKAQAGVDTLLSDKAQVEVDTLMPDKAQIGVDKFLPDKAQVGVDTLLPDTAQAGVDTLLPDTAQAGVDTPLPDTAQAGVDTLLPDTAQAGVDMLLPDKAQAGVDTSLPDKAQAGVDTFLPDTALAGVDTFLPDKAQTEVHTLLPDKAQIGVDTLLPDTAQGGVDTLLSDKAQTEVHTLLPDKAQIGVDTLLPDTAQAIVDRLMPDPAKDAASKGIIIDKPEIDPIAGDIKTVVDTKPKDEAKTTIVKQPIDAMGSIVDRTNQINIEKKVIKDMQPISDIKDTNKRNEGQIGKGRIEAEITPESLKNKLFSEKDQPIVSVQSEPGMVPDFNTLVLPDPPTLQKDPDVPSRAKMVVEGAILNEAVPDQVVQYSDMKHDEPKAAKKVSKQASKKDNFGQLKKDHLLEKVLTGKQIEDKQSFSTLNSIQQLPEKSNADISTSDLKAEFQDLGITPKKNTENALYRSSVDKLGSMDNGDRGVLDGPEHAQPENLGPPLESLCESTSFIDSIGYAEYPGRCDKLVQCYNYRGRDIAVLRDCPYGYFWHQQQVLCRPPAEVPCYDDPCLDIDIISYNRSGGCRSYYSCEFGISIPQCCPMGFRYDGRRCVADATCYDPCSTPFDIEHHMKTKSCKFLPDEYNPYGYITMEHNGLRIRACPSGTVFNSAECGCRALASESAKYRQSRRRMNQCKPQFSMDFDHGFKEDSGSNMAFDVSNVVITDGAAQFDGKGKITLWGFMNRELGTRFAIKLRFKPDPTATESGSLIANCGMTGSPTVSIDLQKHMLVSAAKSQSFNAPTKIKDHFDPYSWNDITFVYDGSNFMVLTNGYKQRKPLGGLLETRSNAIVIGGCPRPGKGFKGLIDNIEIYSSCIPRDILKKRNRR